MDGKEPDGELAEFRPWSHFESAPARDWRPAVAAGIVVVVLGGGWLAQRAFQPDEVASDPIPIVATTVGPPVVAEATPLVELPETDRPALLSEADLMAEISGATDLAILALAEEVVIEHFTSGPGSDAEPPGYVEWAHAIEVRVGDGDWTVAVRFSAVALSETPWRLPVRMVEVVLRPDGMGWRVEGFPRLVDDPAVVRWEPPELTEVPAGVRAEFEDAGWTVMGGVERDDGWDVAVADPTGAVVLVFAEQP